MHRYIPVTESDQAEMLKAIGKTGCEQLFSAIPEEIRLQHELKLPRALSEAAIMKRMKERAAENIPAGELPCFLGGGCYDHYIPAAIDHLAGRSEFLTAYTPYQPEISQGTLQAIFEYQTNICELTALPYANASLYDVATATGEAAYIACAATRRKKILVSRAVDPQIRAVLRTMLGNIAVEVVELSFENFATSRQCLEQQLTGEMAAVIVQSPNFFGTAEAMRELAAITHTAKALFIAVVDPVSLALLPAPGEYEADIATGNAQPLGNPMNFGGPHIGFMAVAEKYLRRLPGRIAGQTVDHNGQRCYVLTLQAREQHIRREKATSNICSNQALCALRATMYLSLLGPAGLREVAAQCLDKAVYARHSLLETGAFVSNTQPPYFREFVLESRTAVREINDMLTNYGIIGGYDLTADYPELKNHILFCVTEKRTKSEIDELCRVLG